MHKTIHTCEVDFIGADMDIDIEEVLALDGPVSGGVPAHSAQVADEGGAAAMHPQRGYGDHPLGITEPQVPQWLLVQVPPRQEHHRHLCKPTPASDVASSRSGSSRAAALC